MTRAEGFKAGPSGSATAHLPYDRHRLRRAAGQVGIDSRAPAGREIADHRADWNPGVSVVIDREARKVRTTAAPGRLHMLPFATGGRADATGARAASARGNAAHLQDALDIKQTDRPIEALVLGGGWIGPGAASARKLGRSAARSGAAAVHPHRAALRVAAAEAIHRARRAACARREGRAEPMTRA
jgi:hypothetical protein